MAGADILDRGSYGVAIAVPDENVWYKRYDLNSHADKEQWTALCASVPPTPAPAETEDVPETLLTLLELFGIVHFRPLQDACALFKGVFVSVLG